MGRNGSDVAHSTLEQILAGTFSTDDDKIAVEAALKALASHPNKANDALLLRVLTAPADLRPASREGPWPARDLQAKAFELVKPTASGDLRTKLAAALVESRARIDEKDPIDEFLLSPTPLNCTAQLLFFEKGNVNRDIKAALEQLFVSYSSMAMARCLKVSDEVQAGAGGASMFGGHVGMGGLDMSNVRGGQPPNGVFVQPGAQPGFATPGRPGEPAKTDKSDKPDNMEKVDPKSQLAGQLWSESFRALLEPELADLRSFDKQPQTVVLAATIPLDSTRAALAKLLYKRWTDGPKALETAGLTDRTITDPGFLVLVKSCCLREESAATPRATNIISSRPARNGYAASTYGGGQLGGTLQKKQQAKQDWMDVSAKLVSGWCKRFNDAASAKDSDNEQPDRATDNAGAKLPEGFQLSKEATLVASHRVSLPGTGPTDLSQARPDTLEVYYVRAEETGKLKRILGYYNRQAHASLTDARILDGKIWLDSHPPGSQKDRRRSVDVLVTRPTSGGFGAADNNSNNEDMDLTVEILIVEIKDPPKT